MQLREEFTKKYSQYGTLIKPPEKSKTIGK
jgi:hypothetical protein